jgi:hypothetical protein
MTRALFVAMMFLSVSAAAQSGPCSAGIQDPPIFAVVLGSPVVLSFQHTTNSIFTPPSVTVVGHEITAWQLPSGANQFADNCNSQTVSLGALAAGSYTVTWNYQVFESSGPVPPAATFSFAFTVPETAPCVSGIEIQPASPITGRPVAIAYSIPDRGFLQPPSVTIDDGRITIDQPAAIADPYPGYVPSCGRGAVTINSLQPGLYAVVVRSFASAELVGSLTVRPAARMRAVRGH